MTNATIAVDPLPPRRRKNPWVWLLSLGLHGLAFVLLLPWLQTEMAFDRREERTRTQEVKQREAVRQAEALARRERTRLSESEAQTLRREEERKREKILADHARSLEEMARNLEREAAEKLERVAKRGEEDLAKMRAQGMMDRLQVAQGDADRLRPSPGESEKQSRGVKDKLAELEKKLEAILAKPDDYQALAEEVAGISRDIAKTALGALPLDPENHYHRHHLVRTAETAREIAAMADTLASGLDMEHENHGGPTPLENAATTGGKEGPAAGPAGAYDEAVRQEGRLQAAHNQAQAADLAMRKGMGLSEARKAVSGDAPSRPNLGEALAQPALGSVADLDRHRAHLDQALVETRHMVQRGQNMVGHASSSTAAGSAGGEIPGGLAERTLAMQSLARGTGVYGQVIDFTGFTGGGSGMGGQQGLDSGSGSGTLLDLDGSRVRDPRDPTLMAQVKRVNPDVFGRETLPGRKFTDDASRRGWMFVDTWYVIGPWDNEGNLRHAVPRGPEEFVDLDATYNDGKFSKRPGHPDETLAWQFYQSDQVRCQPLRVYDNSTYFAYTDLFSDRDREVLITISTDDAAKAWLNGVLVWEDLGGSPWRVGEGFRRVILRKGYNSLLVRIENGPIFCVWSVVLMPTDG